MPQEVEIKLWTTSPLAEIRKRVKELGFVLKKRRVFEENVLLDTVSLSLRKKRELIRLRKVGSKSILTYKGPPKPGEYRSREELECELPDASCMELIFGRLGYSPHFRYEKYREEYQRRGTTGTLTIDETPIGNFLELEGPPRWIDKSARDLGFSRADYITQSYGNLYLAWCREHGIGPTNMVFASGNPRAHIKKNP